MKRWSRPSLGVMAEVGTRSHHFGEITEVLGVTVLSLDPVSVSFTAKRMSYSPDHGDCFHRPLFNEFIKRIMPEKQKKT